jgi:hypothetical protein
VHAFLLFACTASPPGGGGPDEPAFSLSLSQGDLTPAFDPDILHYGVAEASLVDKTTTITASDPAAILEQRTMDGEVLTADAGALDVPLTADQYVRVSVDDRVYQVTVLPTDLGPVHAEGVASEGAILLEPAAFDGPIPALAPYLLIVDEHGVPIWYRRQSAPAFDFHATADGHLVYLGYVDDVGWRGVVLGEDYAIERLVDMQHSDDAEIIGVDTHFFDFLGDDAIAVGIALRYVNMEKYGADAGCCQVRDYVIQQIAPDDSVVFEWNSKDHLDLVEGVPKVFFENLRDGFEYAHINSWAVDPEDGTWLLSNLWAAQVFRIAPRDMTWHGVSYQAGDILERIGGHALSDYTFVNDDRDLGWTGWLAQHSARLVASDRLLLYDNGYVLDDGAVIGDSRAVEYQLDRKAGTATRVWDYTAKGSGFSPAGGAVQRLPDGSTLIGWSSAPAANGVWGPSVSEIDPDGNSVFDLTIADGLWSYRVSKAVLVDGKWTSPEE